ncbi:MAG TPA: MFS transporter, partial [Crocinitomicaceae bacterium]|nr:MFS transporter [Crocinitomicaceae bacterium]
TSILGFKTDEAGLVMSFFGLGSLIGSVVGGWLTDRVGAFYVQFFTLLLASPIFIYLAGLTTVTEFCITIFVLSCIYQSFHPANSAAIASYAKKGNITRAFSLNRMAINLGFSFGPALGGFLATFSFAWLFYGNAFAVFATSIVFFLYFFRRKERNENSEEIGYISENAHEGSPYTDKWFMIFSVFGFLFACVFFQLLSILPLYYKNHLHFTQGEIGLILGFNGLLVVSTEMLFVSYAEKKWNVYTSLIIGCVLLLVSFAWLLFDNSTLSCYFSMVLLSISEILVLPFMSTIAAKRSSIHNRGAYMGLNGLSVSAAFVIMPYLATLFIENYSFNHLWIANVVVLIVASLGFYVVKGRMTLS